MSSEDRELAKIMREASIANRRSRRLESMRAYQSDTRNGAGPSRVGGGTSFTGELTRKLHEMGRLPTGAMRTRNDDKIRDGEDNERIAHDTFARWERDAVHERQRDEGIGVKPYGPHLPRAEDFEEQVVVEEVVVLVEKDAAARVERGDMAERTDMENNKKKSVKWKDINDILAPGREARTAALRRRREMTGNAFKGADFVDLTSGTPSWFQKGEKQKDDEKKTPAA